MIIYRIEERKFDNGKSEFKPQFRDELCGNVDENGLPKWISFYNSPARTLKIFDSYNEALAVINKDKQNLSTPVEVIIHYL